MLSSGEALAFYALAFYALAFYALAFYAHAFFVYVFISYIMTVVVGTAPDAAAYSEVFAFQVHVFGPWSMHTDEVCRRPAATAAAAAATAEAAVAADAPSHLREGRRKRTAATQLAPPRINGQPSV